MMRLLATAFVLFFIFACSGDDHFDDSCSTRATVRNLTGMDGCGFVFELENGTRLEPVRTFIGFCGTPPLPKEVTEDPLYNFEWIDGKTVTISYELSMSPSICMVGQTVKITCIRELTTTSDL
jgi:hypothetical protein